MLDLSIIIVSWNVKPLLIACLDSLYQHLENPDCPNKLTYEIILIDSHSTDDSAAYVQAHYPAVKLTAATENIGYVKANNLGLEQANGAYLLLLNPDTEIQGCALQDLLAYLSSHPQAGIIGPHTLNTDGTYQSTKRRFPGKITAFFESTLLQSKAPTKILDNFYANDIPNDSIAQVDWVQGSCLMAKREVYQQIGGLDPNFVMYSEELDWCKRAKNNGWQVIYFGEASIIHHGGKSSEQASAFKHIQFQKSKIYYYKKHHGAVFAFLLRLFLIVTYGLDLGLESLKLLLRHKPSLRKERIHIYWQVMKALL
ncbi:glycosyltransferase family 2 protein [Anaerolineales bacterium]